MIEASGSGRLKGNLGERSHAFIGRKSELSEILDNLRAGSAVTIVGEPGIGKSSLAWVAAQRLPELPGGKWRVPARTGMSDDELLFDLALLLIPSQEGPIDAKDLLMSLIARQPCLVIFDEAEKSEQAVGAAALWLQENCPESILILTSRFPIPNLQSKIVKVGPMNVPSREDPSIGDFDIIGIDASRLFLDRFGEGIEASCLTASDKASVVDLCHWLGGNPMALRIAAAEASVRSIAVVHDAIAMSLGQKPGPGTDALLSSIELAFDGVDGESAHFARRLSVLCSNWSMDAALGVASSHYRERTHELLRNLCFRGLLDFEVEEDGRIRYTLSDSVTAFLASSLSPAERLDAEQAHCNHFLALAESANGNSGTELTTGFDAMTRDYPNICLAMTRCIANRDTRAFRFAIEMASFWQRRRPFEEGRAFVMGAAELIESAGSTPTEARVQNIAATYHWMVGAYDVAEVLATRSKGVFESNQEDLGLGMALSNLSIIQKCRGRLELAEEFAASAVSLLRKSGDIRRLIAGLNNLGAIQEDLGKFVPASEALQESIALAGSIGDRWTVMRAHANLAELSLHAGLAELAAKGFEASLKSSLELRDDPTILYSIEGAGMACLELGKHGTAIALLEFAERLRAEKNLPATPQQLDFLDRARARLESELSRQLVLSMEHWATKAQMSEVLEVVASIRNSSEILD